MNPLAIFVFVKDHWKGCGAAAALVAAFAAGYHAHARLNPPTVCAPAITAQADDHAAAVSASASSTSTETGAKRKITLNFDPAHGSSAHVADFPERPSVPGDLCRPIVVPGLDAPVNVPQGERLESVTIEEDDPSRSETKAATEQASTEDRHLDLTVKPAPVAQAPRLELQLGLEDVLSARTARVAGRVRVSDRIWLELSGRPAEWMAGRKDFGIAAAIGF